MGRETETTGPLNSAFEGSFSPSDLLVVDIEASGLHKTSYPIQIGWCGLDLKPRSFYVRRPRAWGDDDWSLESERVHGISRRDLDVVGRPVEEVAQAYQEACQGRIVVSDSPGMEFRWSSRLLIEANATRMVEFVDRFDVYRCFAFQDAELTEDPLLISAYAMAVRKRYPHTHKADDDALSLAAVFRCLADPEFRSAFRQDALEIRGGKDSRSDPSDYGP